MQSRAASSVCRCLVSEEHQQDVRVRSDEGSIVRSRLAGLCAPGKRYLMKLIQYVLMPSSIARPGAGTEAAHDGILVVAPDVPYCGLRQSPCSPIRIWRCSASGRPRSGRVRVTAAGRLK